MSRQMRNAQSMLARFFAAGDAGEFDSFDAYLHHDVVVHAPMGLSTVGLRAERESWRAAKNAVRDLHHEFLSVLQDGAMEAARCVVTGTLDGAYGGLKAVSKPFKVDQSLFARIRDGRIEELWEIVDTASLLSQLGNSEEISGTSATSVPSSANASRERC